MNRWLDKRLPKPFGLHAERRPAPATALPVMGMACLLVLSLALNTSTPLHAGTRGLSSFAKTHGTLEKLQENQESTRDQWLKVIQSFLTIHRVTKDVKTAERSLFLAGRASLELYRRSGKVEDLDAAIGYLNKFNRNNRTGPYLIPCLRELKEAHLLKRKLPNPAPETAVAPLPGERLSANADETGQPQPEEDPGPKDEPARAPDPSSCQAEQKKGHEPVWTGLSPKYRGNPFWDPANQAPQWTTIWGLRSASIPPASVSDGLPMKKPTRRLPKGLVIVIDPGHGGKDPGAVSQNGLLKEKDLTLDIAKRLKTMLENKRPGINVTLTRTEDRYLALEDRTALANSLDADLLISVHCNAASDAGSKGVETYFLNKASSRRAMKVAAREKGISQAQVGDLEATLLDLMVTSKKNESAKLAATVHEALIRNLGQAISTERDRGVKQAPFYVLLGAKMPAILVECAFISNSRDQRKLTSSAYLDTIAEGLANGTHLYLEGLGDKG